MPRYWYETTPKGFLIYDKTKGSRWPIARTTDRDAAEQIVSALNAAATRDDL